MSNLKTIWDEKVYHVKKYRKFPFKEDNDKVIKVCSDLNEAIFERNRLQKKAKGNERLYVTDYPHALREATVGQEEKWSLVLKNCGLR